MRPEDHQRGKPDLRVQIEAQDQHDDCGEEQVCRKGGEKLHDRLRSVGEPRPQSDPYPDRHPDQRGQGDQQGVLRVIGTQDNQGQNNNSQARTTTGSNNNGQ